jgi:hypothetical protein
MLNKKRSKFPEKNSAEDERFGAKNMCDFCRKSRYFEVSRKRCQISKLWERHTPLYNSGNFLPCVTGAKTREPRIRGSGTPLWVALSKVLSGLGNVTQLFLQHTFDDRGGMAQTGALGSFVGRLDGFEDCK